MKALKRLNDKELTTRLGAMQAALRIAYVFLIILGIGCTIMAAIPFFEYGFDYAITIAPAYLLLFVFVLLLLGFPIYYLRINQKEIMEEITKRAVSSEEMATLIAVLAAKRRRATIILLSIIIGVPVLIFAYVGVSIGDIGSSDDATVSCGYCNREFKRSSSNGRSIQRRNLCENCYENMEIMEDALDQAGN